MVQERASRKKNSRVRTSKDYVSWNHNWSPRDGNLCALFSTDTTPGHSAHHICQILHVWCVVRPYLCLVRIVKAVTRYAIRPVGLCEHIVNKLPNRFCLHELEVIVWKVGYGFAVHRCNQSVLSSLLIGWTHRNHRGWVHKENACDSHWGRVQHLFFQSKNCIHSWTAGISFISRAMHNKCWHMELSLHPKGKRRQLQELYVQFNDHRWRFHSRH